MTVNAGGDIIVQALENAGITAEDRSVVDASKDAKGGVISVNMVNSDAAAHIVESEVTTVAGSGGNVVVDARNTAIIDATSTTKAETGQNALGIVVSLNTVGYDSSNILFSAGKPAWHRCIEPGAAVFGAGVDRKFNGDSGRWRVGYSDQRFAVERHHGQ